MHVRRNQLEYEDDLVRLTLIYFLECGLLGNESQVHINLDYLSMIENLDYFNEYSWGLVSYNDTLTSLYKALNLHHGKLNKSSTYSLSGVPLAFQYDELKSQIQALNIKIDGMTSDLGNFQLDSMHEFQSIHKTMLEMFDYIKHEYHPAEHATHSNDVNEDAIVCADFENRDLIITTETQENSKNALSPPTNFDPKRPPPNELEMKFFTYMTFSDDVILNYNLCDKFDNLSRYALQLVDIEERRILMHFESENLNLQLSVVKYNDNEVMELIPSKVVYHKTRIKKPKKTNKVIVCSFYRNLGAIEEYITRIREV
ncbi:hypothetical protein FNV43_RR15003 [Rhamnella rubrinervis]|uniref:DUF1985 domain-containing protein n=1 Tax=Rhamnella rubrinervis TaxID=2594499 RepID=A0A8K0H455_9ROSA|nr:hypothetical protein FNV43_RR15003 [Rhamnella rubrinervis]